MNDLIQRLEQLKRYAENTTNGFYMTNLHESDTEKFNQILKIIKILPKLMIDVDKFTQKAHELFKCGDLPCADCRLCFLRAEIVPAIEKIKEELS